MRRARLKLSDTPMFYHLYNRVAGAPSYYPFGPEEKEQFVRLLHKLGKYFTVKVVAYQVLSNHFHVIAYAPDRPPEPEEVCRRYEDYHGGRHKLKPSDPRCEVFGRRMRDISWFMHALESQFSRWFNDSRSEKRRGGLWADRFKNTLLGDAQAVWECLKYVEMNPVRAGMVSNPADYRFCTYGAWCGRGRHPLEDNVLEVLLPWLEGMYPFGHLRTLRKALRAEFAAIQGAAEDGEDTDGAFTVQLDRRVRYWADGLVIGSELFIRDLVQRHGHILRRRSRGLTWARAPDDTELSLCCYSRLRAV